MKLSQAVTILLLAAVVVNVALMTSYVALRKEAGVYTRGQQFPIITGIDLNGLTHHARDAPCYIIRITADDCPYCRSDQLALGEIWHAARERGCEMFALAPRAGQMAGLPDEDITQLKFVSMDLGESIYPFLTPQTIVLDADRKVMWSWLGALGDRAAKNGVGALRSAGAP